MGDEGQKVYGTFREQLSTLQDVTLAMREAGGATPEEYATTLTQLLKVTEGMRIKHVAAKARLESQISYEDAGIRGASQLGAIITNVAKSRYRERIKLIEAEKEIQKRALKEDKEVLVRYRLEEKWDQVAALEKSILEREGTVAGDLNAAPVGSEQEQLIINAAIKDAAIKDLKANEAPRISKDAQEATDILANAEQMTNEPKIEVVKKKIKRKKVAKIAKKIIKKNK